MNGVSNTLRIVNTGCDVRIRPEFSISCSNGPIQQGDMVIKWQHPLGWNQTINYTIDANGDATLNVLDVVTTVNAVLCGSACYNECIDMNGDGILNVLDIVQLVTLVLDN